MLMFAAAPPSCTAYRPKDTPYLKQLSDQSEKLGTRGYHFVLKFFSFFFVLIQRSKNQDC